MEPVNSIADLLSNESFLNFCQQRNKADIAYWEAYIQQHPEQAPMIRQAQQEWKYLLQGIRQADMQAQLKVLQQQVAQTTAAPMQVAAVNKKHWLTPVRKYAAAAVIAAGVLGTLIWALQPSQQQLPQVTLSYPDSYNNKAGERQHMQLPDGSEVVLNAASKLTLGAEFKDGKRDVYLEGEAYFDVIHDANRPFTVYMKEATIKVLGTSFNARAYNGEDYTETTLIKGSVEVTLKRENRVIRLLPREKLHYRAVPPDSIASKAVLSGKTYLTVSPVRMDPVDSLTTETAWTENKLVFFNEPLEELVKRLERWYGIHITIADEEMKQLRFSGDFKQEDLPRVLEILQLTMPFRYRQASDSSIVIYK